LNEKHAKIIQLKEDCDLLIRIVDNFGSSALRLLSPSIEALDFAISNYHEEQNRDPLQCRDNRNSLVNCDAQMERLLVIQSKIKDADRSRLSRKFRLGEALHNHWQAFAAAILVVLLASLFGWYHQSIGQVWYFEYFDGTSLEGPPLANGQTPTLQFDWGANSPKADVPEDYFSLRLYSCLALNTRTHLEFKLGSDDGSRLFIDDQKLIDQWQNQRLEHQSESITLDPGRYLVRVEYFEGYGLAALELLVSKNHQPMRFADRRHFTKPRRQANGQPTCT